MLPDLASESLSEVVSRPSVAAHGRTLAFTRDASTELSPWRLRLQAASSEPSQMRLEALDLFHPQLAPGEYLERSR